MDAISSAAIPNGGQAGPTGLLNLMHVLAEVGRLTEETLGAGVAALRRQGAVQDGAVGLEPRQGQPAVVVAEASELGGEPRILVEMPSLCVLWKPPGWTVTVGVSQLGSDDPQPGVLADDEEDEEDDGENEVEDRSAGRSKALQDWVMARLGASCPVVLDAELQHGLLHRLDKGTSGLIACATTYSGYYLGKLDFCLRRTSKAYVCLCRGHLPGGPRFLEAPLRVVREGRLKRSVSSPEGLAARTEVLHIGRLAGAGDEEVSVTLVELRLHTGRKHQVRAHLASEGCPLVGDSLYGGRQPNWCSRPFLHAARLRLSLDPETSGNVSSARQVEAFCPLPADLRDVLARLRPLDEPSRRLLARWLSS